MICCMYPVQDHACTLNGTCHVEGLTCQKNHDAYSSVAYSNQKERRTTASWFPCDFEGGHKKCFYLQERNDLLMLNIQCIFFKILGGGGGGILGILGG